MAIFIEVASEYQETIFIIRAVIAVVAVHRMPDRKPDLRDFALKLCELFEERAAEVERTAKTFRIPFITPPLMQLVRLHRRVWREVGDHCLPREIALAMIEMSFVAPGESPLPATVRAERW